MVKRIQFKLGKILFTIKRSEWPMNRYKIVGNISAGAHGNVFKAVHSPSYNAQVLSSQLKEEKYFAIKKVFLQKVNSILSIVREIKSLQYLGTHQNVSCPQTDHSSCCWKEYIWWYCVFAFFLAFRSFQSWISSAKVLLLI